MRKIAILLNPDDGINAKSPEEAEQLQAAGYQNCYGNGCNFHISPEAQEKAINEGSGYYTCPQRECYRSFDLMEDQPWHGAPEEEMDGPFHAGGGTRIGLSMQEQAQIGEDIVEGLKSIPGYGPITWWHQGGAVAPSPLDGALREWGIEVKTIGMDAEHHRFVPRSMKEKESKNQQAREMGLKGILGILVMLNYKTSLADIYVREMPLDEPWNTRGGKGIGSFRTNTSQHLIAEVPFKNPFMDPHHPAPIVPDQHEEMPF